MGAEYIFTPNYRVEQWAILHFYIYLQSKVIQKDFFPSKKYSRLSSISLRASLKFLMFPSLSGISLTSFLLFICYLILPMGMNQPNGHSHQSH